jgi:hypothetical protein
VWGGSASKADGSATSLSSIFAQQRADDERKHHERSLRRARAPGGTGSWGAGLSTSSPLLGPRPAAPPSQSQWGMLPEPSFVPLKDILEQEHSQLEQQRLLEAEVKEQFRIERLIAQERQAAAAEAAALAGGAKGAQANGKGNGKAPRGAGAGRRGRCGDSTSQEQQQQQQQQQQQDRKAPSDHAATSGQKEAATTEALSTEAAQLAATPRAAKGTADGGKGGGAKGSVNGGSKGAGRGGGKTGSKGRGRGCGCENEDAMAIAPQTTETTGIGDTLAALV